MTDNRFTRIDCNAMNLLGMFCTSLTLIRFAIINNDKSGAINRIDQILKSINKLKDYHGKTFYYK